MRRHHLFLQGTLAVLLVAIPPQAARAATEVIIHSFNPAPSGAVPTAPLIQASDGNLYGTASVGGSGGSGMVFRISDLGGTPTESLIYSFAGGTDGAGPLGGLIEASDGNLYGTTSGGGAGCGTVFKISDFAGNPAESVIYRFSGGSDGCQPMSSLIQASDGNLYGTTSNGGSANAGTVFRIGGIGGTPVETAIHSFGVGSDGAVPFASLLQASDGNLYGTTTAGGPGYSGTVFRISGIGGTPIESVVYGFTGGDGEGPRASLIQATDGNLYGTTAGGGGGNGGGAIFYGTIFRVSGLAGTPTTSLIYSFAEPVGSPFAALVQASDGNLYGTTQGDLIGDHGTVFQVTGLNSTPAVTVVHNFDGIDGANPAAALVQASDGNLYGTTAGTDQGCCALGIAQNVGTVFRISNVAESPTVELIHAFAAISDGAYPEAPPIQAADGSLYGTTEFGGAGNSGTVFRITDPEGSPLETVVHSFSGGGDGADLRGPVMQASDGNLYGTTYSGGASGMGTVFRITEPGGTPGETVLYSFSGGPDGGNPMGGLIQATDGNLYGTTFAGGASGNGTVFRVSALAGTPILSVVYSFAGPPDGAQPSAGLLQASDGNLYGTTYTGGLGSGTIFEIANLASAPTENVAYSFMRGSDGAYPLASMIQASDGNLYGTTSQICGPGDHCTGGTIFRLSNPDGNASLSTIFDFTGGLIGSLGSNLVQAQDGSLYGATSSGGPSGSGAIFRLSDLSGANPPALVYSFHGWPTDGYAPTGLALGSVGTLYGTTLQGGSANVGTVFIFSPNAASPCVPDSHTLCLANGRFQVQAQWTDFNGNSGAGTVVPGATSNNSGVMWFFGPDNWELLIKVLDGCAVNGHYWVLGAAATNVAYTIQVTDTQTGEIKTYSNPLGTVSPSITDTAAFGSCP